MTDLYKTLFFPLLILSILPFITSAQFKGGNSSGFTFAAITNQPLGRNIFSGGIDDGVTVASVVNQPLGRNIFIGGNNDGINVSASVSQPLGQNIFLGGSNDGVNVAGASNLPLGQNIFLGGNDDGTMVAGASGQPMGRNIFLGGANDGWAMGFSASLALPLTLSDFNGKWQQNDAQLSWKTATELNTGRFELERSFDGVGFTSVYRIAAAGQSTTEKSYRYTDVNIRKLLPPNTTNIYYRLRSVDKNGEGTYSGILILKTSAESAVEYSVYPNPAKDIITISSNLLAPLADTYIRLADANGKVLQLHKMTGSKKQVTVSNYASGMYYLQLVSGNKIVYTQKIIITK